MPRPRQHLKRYRHTAGRAYQVHQVQSPPKEAPLLGCALAEVSPSRREGAVDFATSPRSHVLAHRYGHTVYDEGFSFGKQSTQQFQDVLQPPGGSHSSSQSVHSAAEPRCADRFGDVTHSLHHAKGSLMMVLKVHGGHYATTARVNTSASLTWA